MGLSTRDDVIVSITSISGIITFTNYCSLGVIVNGSIDITSSYDAVSEELISVTHTFDKLIFTSSTSTKSYTLSGTFILTSSGQTNNYLSKNNNTLKVNKIENLVFANTEALSFSGRIYHHDYGYIDVSTTTPFTRPSSELYPSSGVMVITGANKKSAKLTAMSNTRYDVSADLDSDGYYETIIGSYLWEE